MSVKNVEDVYALSSHQRLMLLQACSAAVETVLVEQFTCTLIGNLDRAAFRQAWDDVVRRHAALRTGFAWEGLKKPLQFVRRGTELEWRETNLSDQDEADQLRRWTEIKDTDRRQGFELTKPPLMRISLASTADNAHHVAWTVHHLVLDGWSLPLVLQEVFALYKAHHKRSQNQNHNPNQNQNQKGVACRLPSARPFREYLQWLARQDMDAARDFWRTRLDGYRPDSRLPMRRPLEEDRHPHSAYDEFETTLSSLPLTELQTRAGERRVTVGTLLVAAWGFLLGRLRDQDEVTCGIAVSGRPPTLAGAETIVGPLMNNLPLRIRLSRHEPVADWLRTVQADLADIQQFAYTPCEQINQWCGLSSAARPFESLFVYENYPWEKSRQVGHELEIRDAHGTASSSFPLTVIVIPDKELRLRIRYRRRWFSLASIQRLAAHFAATLENMTAEPSQRLVDVSVCSENQRAELAVLAADKPPDEILEHRQVGPTSQWLIESAQDGPSWMWQIWDHWNRLAAVGVAGELCAVRPSDVAPQHAHDAKTWPSDSPAANERSNEPTPGQSLIRTGLLVRRLPDGTWQWLGHTHGTAVGDCRIDLRAVENRVCQHPLVADATVRVHDEAGMRTGVAVYVVPAKQSKSLLDVEGRTLLSAQLRSALDHVLPFRMLPIDIVTLDSIPRLADGSTDVASLPTPRRSRPESAPPYVAPRDAVEARLAEIWSTLLGIHPIGIHDNFVELGGHSTLAVSLIGRIEEEFQRKLPLIAMFSEPTIENLADLLRRPAASSAETVLVPIHSQGQRQPLFCVHPAGGTVFCYLALARHLDPQQPVYGLQAVGIDGQQAPHSAVTEMAAHYVAAIQSAQTSGPYAVCGWSSGGIVAYEVARQLEAAGQRVSLLALFDAAIRGDEGEYTQKDVLAMMLMMFPGDSRQEVEALRERTVAEQLAYFEQRAKSARLILDGADQSQIRFIHDVFQANVDAIASYRPQPYHGKVTLFRAATAATPMHRDPLLGWGKLAADVEICEVPGDHVTMFREPTVRLLASLLERYL